MRVVVFGDEIGLEVFEETLFRKWNVCAAVVSPVRKAAIAKAEELKERYSIPCIVQLRKKNASDLKSFLDRIREFLPDLIYVNSYSQILSEELLTIPRIGSFNVHAGILPEYRGANIINWVLINGEGEAGVTIHKITPTIDTGPIMLSQRTKIDFQDTVVSLRSKLRKIASKLIDESITMLEAGEISLVAQNEENACYWPRRKPEDGYFSWEWDELRIYNLIRALVYPWPGAYTIIDGQKIVYDRFLSFEKVKRLKNEYCGRDSST